jgi:hypothetical protein
VREKEEVVTPLSSQVRSAVVVSFVFALLLWGPNEFYVHDLMMMMIPGVKGSSFVRCCSWPATTASPGQRSRRRGIAPVKRKTKSVSPLCLDVKKIQHRGR